MAARRTKGTTSGSQDTAPAAQGAGAIPVSSLLAVTRRLSGAALGKDWLVPAILLAAFAAVTLYYALPRPKSFFLDLETEYLSVVTDADTQIVWELPEVRICLPRHRIDAAAYGAFPAPARPLCDSDVYLEVMQQTVDIDWPRDVTLVLRSAPARSVDIVVRFAPKAAPVRIGEIEIVTETLLNLPGATFDAFGGLGLTGQLVAGQVADNGTVKLLQGGSYETRERFWFRDSAQLVDSGFFHLGDVVSIESRDGGRALSTYAFLTLPRGQTDGAMRVIASSEEAFSQLRLTRARARASVLEPGWAQRLSRDPLAIGFATLLSLFGATLAVVKAFGRRKP